MAPQRFSRVAAPALFALALIAAIGCSDLPRTLIPNERPRIELTAAPVNEADTASYAYQIHWSAYDSDGQIDHYEYAIDPQGGTLPETVWVHTRKTSETIYFRASQPDTSGHVVTRAIDPHTFVIKAFDDDGQQSPHQARTFFSYTIAPAVSIVNPQPSHLLYRQVSPNVRITWEGRDDDGVVHRAPIQYKYRLLSGDDPEYPSMTAIANPVAARRYFASTNFAGWDSTGGDTTFVQYTGLPTSFGGAPYVFLVVAFDEAGAYSADWTLDGNMLAMSVADGSVMGPRFTVWSDYFHYEYADGRYAPTDPDRWIWTEIPGNRAFTVRWFATPAPGATEVRYRWKLDGVWNDETPRTDEETDWWHWSAWSPHTTSATIGPFPQGGEHFLYIEALDNTGLKSIAIVRLNIVPLSFDHELLVVDDTRLELDLNTTLTSGIRRNYTTEWPAAAELDTFLFAAGGFPWRRTATGRSGVSPPGLFAGYSFDTLGTRQGYELATHGVPLSVLGRYRRLIWLVDGQSALRTGSPQDVATAMTTLRYMSRYGRANTLQQYLFSGGKAWLAGGGVAYSSLIEFSGIHVGDPYGMGHTIFSASAGELRPGRLLYDYPRWRSETVVSRLVTSVRKSPRAVGNWSHPGHNYVGTVNAPDYSALPPALRRRSSALGDTLPPTRSTGQATTFYTNGSLVVEYLTLPNAILEDADPDPLVTHEISTLDTLYELSGGALATNVTGQRPASMTYYHGMAGQPVVFTGFDLWSWSRVDCAALVDFVLQDLWGMQRGGVPARRAVATARTAAPRGSAPGAPISRKP